MNEATIELLVHGQVGDSSGRWGVPNGIELRRAIRAASPTLRCEHDGDHAGDDDGGDPGSREQQSAPACSSLRRRAAEAGAGAAPPGGVPSGAAPVGCVPAGAAGPDGHRPLGHRDCCPGAGGGRRAAEVAGRLIAVLGTLGHRPQQQASNARGRLGLRSSTDGVGWLPWS